MLKLEAVLGETKGFAVGEQPSVADAKIFIFVTEYFDDKDAARRVPAAAPPPRCSCCSRILFVRAFLLATRTARVARCTWSS